MPHTPFLIPDSPMASDAKANILLVDDHPENLLALEAILQDLGQTLVKATSGAQALRCLLNQDFAVILLDVQMPDLDGFETATLIRQRERSHHVPIIFLTAFSTNDLMVFKGYAVGAIDYLFKPIDPEILKSKVAAFVELSRKNAEIKRQSAELAKINAQLRKSEEKFRSLSACSPMGIFLIDNNGKCTYTNPRYQSIFGMTAEKSLGDGWLRGLDAADQEQVLQNLTNSSHDGSAWEYQILTGKGTECWISIHIAPMLSDAGEIIGYVGTVEDISDRKLAEEERAKFIREQAALKEAEATNRMKDEFLATLSHELRTPLNSILGWAKLLRNRKLEEKAITRALETIERNARLQGQLIEDILDVSRIIRGKLILNRCPINLVTVIETAIDTVRLQAEAKQINFESFITPRGLSAAEVPFTVLGDPDRLQQVVWNLLSNAIKFTPQGGQVEIRLSVASEAEPQPTTYYAQIQVSDTGIGIKPDFLAHVFERFRQADGSTTRSQTGLGLGLAIVRHLVELHGGSVRAESPGEGLGATFTVTLPLIEVENNTILQTATTIDVSPMVCLNQAPLENVRLIVVDDDPDTRHFITIALQGSGAEVRAVASASEALWEIQQLLPDVIISDIGMPEEDGYSMIRKIRLLAPEQGGNIPAIALTAYAREEDTQAALAAGFNLYASKPVEITKLVNMVAKLAGRNYYVEDCVI